ncbi:MAG: DinB family protein [Chloroflexota bacterium]
MLSTTTIKAELFTTVLNQFFDETFEHVQGIYLDRGTSLFETLETVSAEEASRPVGGKCASIAGQVEHVRFYMDVLSKYLRGEDPGKVDWAGSWSLTSVNAEEWETLKGQLKEQYSSVRQLISTIENWDAEDPISNALAVVVHTAYHLGEIRQATCTIKG